MYHIFFIHFCIDGYLGCFHILAVVNSAAVKSEVHVSFQIMVFCGYVPRSGIAGSSVSQFSRSVMPDSLRPHGLQHARFPCPSITNSQSLFNLMSIELVMPSNHFILCHPLLLPPSIFPSIWVFSNESALRIRWPKYWSFSFSISPSNEYPGLISSRMDWLDLLAVQETLKSLLQSHNSKASILWCSAFFIVQLSHPHITTGKTIALTRRTFVGKVMSLLFNSMTSSNCCFLICIQISQEAGQVVW